MKLKNKGITLIALVITIIILLILAGVTIGQLTGNGLFDKVKLAKEKYDATANDENNFMKDYENNINKYLNSSREQVTVDKEEYEQLKQDVENMKNQILDLQNKTTLKTIQEQKSDISVGTGTLLDVISITIPKDCYANIYAWYSITNNDSNAYKGIFLYRNGVNIASNGKGGMGGYVQHESNCTIELKEGDVITMKAQQFTGSTQTIVNSEIRINYFEK